MRPLKAQLRAELTMLGTNGETVFLTLGIPVVFLWFFSAVHVLPTGSGHPVDFLVPGILALAVMSTAMTALGIGTGFERGYGVLKRLGATPLGRPRLLAAKIIAITLPVIAVVAIGDELGRYFSRFAGGTGSQTLIAYAGEAALAALTYILGSIFGRSEKSAAHYVKLGITFAIWLLLIAASAWGQWAVAASSLSASASTDLKVAIWLRIGMACMLDAASVAIMFWRGKSLSKFLAQQAQKADATIRVNESELTIQRAQSAAAQREKEDALYLRGKEQAQNVVMRVQELQGEALIEQARSALQLPEGGQSGNGRKLRGGHGW